MSCILRDASGQALSVHLAINIGFRNSHDRTGREEIRPGTYACPTRVFGRLEHGRNNFHQGVPGINRFRYSISQGG